MFYFAIQNRCKITSNFETTFMFSRFFLYFFFREMLLFIYLVVFQGLSAPEILLNKDIV